MKKRIWGQIGAISTCVTCGKEFAQKHKEHAYSCSPDCARIQRGLSGRRRVDRVCPICKNTFITKECWVKRGSGTYCSNKCRWENKYIIEKKQYIKAHNEVSKFLRQGKITKTPCIICGEKEVEGHHHRGYSDDHLTDVIWLCLSHHKQAEEQLRRTGQINKL